VCRKKFEPIRAIQPVCQSYDCMCTYAQGVANKAAIARKKKDARVHKEKLEAIKPKADYLKEAQREFNKWIRLRDEKLPCISCQRFHTGQYHAGHLRSIGSAPHLRFNESNVHKQCSACNNHLSGNALNYRRNLISKIGLEAVEALESDQTPKYYTIDDIKAIKIKYKELIKNETNKTQAQ